MYSREEFLDRLNSEFPEVLSTIDDTEEGLLHCEVAAFRRQTEKAIDNGNEKLVKGHFQLVEKLLQSADTKLENALLVSYIEDLANWGYNRARQKIIKKSAPKSILNLLIADNEHWK